MTESEKRTEAARRKPKAAKSAPTDTGHKDTLADPTELAERLMAARLPDKGNIPRTLWHILHELTLIRVRGDMQWPG